MRRPKNPKSAIAYIRVSTEDQRLGPEAQRAAIESWASREGVTVAGWHVDQGVSGAIAIEARPALGAALADLHAHGAGILVVAKRDRIARDVVIAAMTTRAAAKVGAVVVSADGAGNGDSPADALMRTMLDAFSAHELAQIRARTKAALAAKKAKGEKLGGLTPYGYRLGADGVHLEEDEPEQATIRTVRLLSARGLSRRAIVAELAALGVVSRVGRPLQITQVGRILRAA